MRNKIFVMTSSGPKAYKMNYFPEKVVDEIIQDINAMLDEQKFPEMYIPYYEAKLAEKHKVTHKCISELLAFIYRIHPQSVFNILLGAIAEEMDKNYPDHISDAEEIWVLSVVNGKIGKLPGGKYNYEGFAAFRCKEDIETALEILKPLYDKIYGGEQEDKGCNQD